MRKNFFLGFCLLCFVIQNYSIVALCKEKAPTQYYTYDGIDIGARPIGLGGAFVAVADTGESPFWNPAGLNSLKDNSLSFMIDFSYQSDALWEEVITGTPLEGKKFCHLTFASPQGAMSWRELSNYLESNYFEEVINGERHEIWQDVEIKVNQYVFSVCQPYSESLIVGINLSYLSGRIGLTEKKRINDEWDEPELNLSDGKGFGIDWGFIYLLKESFHLGLMIQNLPGFMYWDDYRNEKLPTVTRMGFASKLTNLLTFSWDYEHRMYKDEEDKKNYHIGLEQIIVDTIFLRAGMYGPNLNENVDITYSYGLGYKKEGYTVDLAAKQHYLSEMPNELVHNYLCSVSIPF